MSTNTHIYELIEEYIIDMIQSNDVKIGDKIPTEAELSEMFNASRATVSKALGHLVYEGLIYRTAGRGSFVRMKQIDQGIKTLFSFSENVKRNGGISSSRVLEYNIVDASSLPNIQEVLGLSDDDKMHRIVRRRYSDDEVIAVQMCFLSVPAIPKLEVKSLESSIYEYIEKELKLEIHQNTVKIQAVNPTAILEKGMGFKLSQPLLKTTAVSYLKDGSPFEVNETYYLSDRYEYKTINYR